MCTVLLPPGDNPIAVNKYIIYGVVRDSSVSIATRYGVDGPGIETLWRVRFAACIQTNPRTHQF